MFTTIFTTICVALQKMEDEKQRVAELGAHFTGFTSAKVQILTHQALQERKRGPQALTLLALLVQKYKY